VDLNNGLPEQIIIDGNKFDVHDLDNNGRALVLRVRDIQEEIAEINLKLVELQTLSNLWAKKLKESMRLVDE